MLDALSSPARADRHRPRAIRATKRLRSVTIARARSRGTREPTSRNCGVSLPRFIFIFVTRRAGMELAGLDSTREAPAHLKLKIGNLRLEIELKLRATAPISNLHFPIFNFQLAGSRAALPRAITLRPP